jgi:Tol biopolymer transport system component
MGGLALFEQPAHMCCFVLVAVNSSLLPITDLGTADAANSGENGLVVYAQPIPDRDDGPYYGGPDYWEIYTIEPDGSDARRLTFDGGVFVKDVVGDEGSSFKTYTFNDRPVWTPDGLTVAYMHRSVDDQIDIRLIDPATGDVRVLFSDWHGSMISWSPDGRRIAYGDERGVWIADGNGSNARIIAESRMGLWPMGPDHKSYVTDVKWSPDGAQVAFVEMSGEGMVAPAAHLSVVDAKAPYHRVSVDVADFWFEYDWAPDSRSLAVAGYANGLVVFNLDGRPPADLTDDWAGSPAWSPDGAMILYAYDGLWSGHGLALYDIGQGASRSLKPGFTGESLEWQPIRMLPHPVGLVDPDSGVWRIPDSEGVVTSFYYGNPGDVPFVGDWDCDGIETPGLFRTSDAFAYLRNSNTQGNADIRFFFGNPSDIPLAGDFNGDGCDTLSIYRPSEARFYIMNELGENEGGLGAADYSFLFGNVGDKPVVGDWDGDGVDEIGLHRETTGFFYYRNTLTTGVADGQLFFGDPGDRFVAGDWGVVDGVDTPGMFRPSNSTFYFRHTLTQGNADSQFTWTGPGTNWVPVAGNFTLD